LAFFLTRTCGKRYLQLPKNINIVSITHLKYAQVNAMGRQVARWQPSPFGRTFCRRRGEIHWQFLPQLTTNNNLKQPATCFHNTTQTKQTNFLENSQ